MRSTEKVGGRALVLIQRLSLDLWMRRKGLVRGTLYDPRLAARRRRM
jgi:hypothetical protein